MPLIVPKTDHQKWRLLVGAFLTFLTLELGGLFFTVGSAHREQEMLFEAQRQKIEDASTRPVLSYRSFSTPITLDVEAQQVVVRYTKPGIKNGTFSKMRLVFQNVNGLRTHSFNRVSESVTSDEEWRIPVVPAGSYRVQVIYEVTGTDGFTVPLGMHATSGWRQK